jgi:hypothetical protein
VTWHASALGVPWLTIPPGKGRKTKAFHDLESGT